MAEDPFISSLVRAVLRRQGYSVTLAAPAEVIRLLRRREPSAGILVTNSPGSFQEFAGAMRFVYLSSSPDPRLAALFPSCRVRKPFAPEELVRAVEELELH